jgi:hypothetical protein
LPILSQVVPFFVVKKESEAWTRKHLIMSQGGVTLHLNPFVSASIPASRNYAVHLCLCLQLHWDGTLSLPGFQLGATCQ